MIGAGPQFEKKYRIPPQGADMDEEFFDSRFKDIDLRLVGLEDQLGAYDTAVDALIQRGLDQINTQLQAAIGAVQTDVESVEAAVAAINTSIAELEEAIASIVSGALPASSVTLAPIAGLAAGNAQAAFMELHAEIDVLGGNLAAKAPIASPDFTGTPTAPNAVAGANNNQIATTSWVVAKFNALIGGAPAALDAIYELAAALGNDANFSATMAAALGGKVSKSGDTIAGRLVVQGGTVVGINDTVGNSGGSIEVRSATSAAAAMIAFHRPSTYAGYFGIDIDNVWKVGGWSMGANAYPIWHNGYKASVAQIRAATIDDRGFTVKGAYDALAEVALVWGATITPNLTTGINFSLAMTGNATLANPTAGMTPGKSGRIRITQDATGGRTLAYDSYFDFEGGIAPSLSTAANAEDYLDYEVITTTKIRARLSKNWS